MRNTAGWRRTSWPTASAATRCQSGRGTTSTWADTTGSASARSTASPPGRGVRRGHRQDQRNERGGDQEGHPVGQVRRDPPEGEGAGGQGAERAAGRREGGARQGEAQGRGGRGGEAHGRGRQGHRPLR